MMGRIVVIGIGSVIMRDDGIGSKVVKTIEDSLKTHNITSIVGETDFQCCFDEINKDDFLIIIDAMTQGKSPGSIEKMCLIDALKNRRKLRTQHEFSLLDLIEMHYPEIGGYFIGIEVAEIGFGFEFSDSLQKCYEQICKSVLNTILNIKEEMKRA